MVLIFPRDLTMRPLWEGMFGGLDAPVQSEGQSNMEEGR